MKIICLLFVVLFISCVELKDPIIDDLITDDGMTKIGTNIYLKRINVRTNECDDDPDNLYFLVDSTGKLLTSGLNVSNMESHGKSSVCESVTIFQ